VNRDGFLPAPLRPRLEENHAVLLKHDEEAPLPLPRCSHLLEEPPDAARSIIREAKLDLVNGALSRSEQKIAEVYKNTLARLQALPQSDPATEVINLVLQKIPSFKKYKFAASMSTVPGSTKVRDGFNELVLVKKEIKKIEKIAKFIEI